MFFGLLHALACDDEIEHRRHALFIGGEGARDGAVDVRRIGHLLAVAAARLGDLGELRLHAEIGIDDAVSQREFLDVADRAERAVVEYAPGDAKLVLGRHRQHVHHHLERAVADEADGRPVGIDLARHRQSRAGKAHAVEARRQDQRAWQMHQEHRE